MMLRAAVSLVAVLGASAAWADVPLTRQASGHLTAQVRVGGGASTPFVIDTGAEGCRVSERFASERRLLKIGDASVLAPAVELDGQVLGDLRCAVTADRATGADGIIGADAIARFVVLVDLRRMRLSVNGGAQHAHALLGPHARAVDASPLPGGMLAAPVRLNNAVGVAVLATGARRSVVNTRFAKASGADEDALSAGATRGAFDLAGRTTSVVDARVADLPVFAAAGLRDAPAMILGLDRLQGLAVVLDYPRRRVWFDPG